MLCSRMVESDFSGIQYLAAYVNHGEGMYNNT